MLKNWLNVLVYCTRLEAVTGWCAWTHREMHAVIILIQSSDGPAKLFLMTYSDACTVLGQSGYPVFTIDVINCVRDFFNNLLVALTTACVTYFRTCVTPLLLIDLDLPTNSHSSLQRLKNLKIRLFATDFHITVNCMTLVFLSVIYSVCCIALI